MPQIDRNTGKLIGDNGQPQEDEKYSSKFLRSLVLDPTIIPPEPPSIIKMNDIPICRLGDFSLLIGRAKSRKTALALYLASLAINPADSLMAEKRGFAGVRQMENQSVLYIDTEQGGYDSAMAANMIYQLSNVSEKIKYVPIRPFSTEEKFELVEYLINEFTECPLVILDGVRDIATKGINDEETATKINDYLLRITQKYNRHIINILHQNKDKKDANARGHLGTELTNKSETTIEVVKSEQQKGISDIKCVQKRGYAEPEPLSITHGSGGVPEILEYMEPEKERKSILPQDYAIEQHEQIISGLFESQKEYSYNEMIPKIQFFTAKFIGVEIGQSKAKQFISYYQDQGFIFKNGESKKAKFERLF